MSDTFSKLYDWARGGAATPLLTQESLNPEDEKIKTLVLLAVSKYQSREANLRTLLESGSPITKESVVAILNEPLV